MNGIKLMATWRYVSLNLREAKPLADLAGVKEDLLVAESFCDLLFEERRESSGKWKVPPNPELWEALTVAASVRYARAFASSVRTKICKTMVETVVKDLPAELASDHQRYIAFRNKYIAHSVNQFEENRVVAYLVPEERGPRGVASISVQHERLVSLGVGDAKRLKTLCVEMRSRISALIETEKARVLEIARKLPVDELYARVDPPPQVASWSDVGKRRP